MNEQGRLDRYRESDEQIPDIITRFEKIITPELVELALLNPDKQVKRDCLINDRVLLWIVLAMGLFIDLPILHVFKACRRLSYGEDTPASSSLCMSRQRLGSEPVLALFELVIRPLANPYPKGNVIKTDQTLR